MSKSGSRTSSCQWFSTPAKGLTQSFNLPAFAIVAFQLRVDLGEVGCLGSGIPCHPFVWNLLCQRPNQDNFSQIGSVFKFGARLTVVQHAVYPVVIVVLFGEVTWVFLGGKT